MPPPENPLLERLQRDAARRLLLVIFGASGDLASWKLLPALYNLAVGRLLPAVRDGRRRAARQEQ